MLDLGLDIDVDTMVSDLASLSRLLQRLGRVGRFERLWPAGRRAAHLEGVPRTMTVLDPVGADGATSLPPSWRTLEPAYLLHATARLLRELGNADLMLPDGIPYLVEQVHGRQSEFALDVEHLAALSAGHRADSAVQEHLAAVHLLPPPGRVSSLADLYRQHLTSTHAATRLGAQRTLLLPVHPVRGGWSLGAGEDTVLPADGALSPKRVRAVLEHTIAVPSAWVAARSPEHRPPAAWRGHPLLAGIALLPMPGPQQFGRHRLHLDTDLGLVHTQD